METVSEVQMSSGREFQRLGADQLKALDPMMVRLADGAKSQMVEEDWRVWERVLISRMEWFMKTARTVRFDCLGLFDLHVSHSVYRHVQFLFLIY